MKRKTILYILSTVVLIIVGLYALLFAFGTQRNATIARPDTIIASLPIVSSQPLMARVAGDLEFRLDTGSDISCITPADLEALCDMGVNVDEKNLPAFGRGVDGHFHVWSKRYVIDLPLHFFSSHPDIDSISVIQNRLSERDNTILNMEFVLIDDSISSSSIGIDFLSKYILEYCEDDRLVRILTKRPEGYVDLTDLKTSFLPTHTPWPGRRYYVEISVDHSPESYFLDTGLQRAAVKLPSAAAARRFNNMERDSIISLLGVFDALTHEAWVECGDRAGTKTAYYCDNNEEPYSFNPITLYVQNLIIDFPNSKIALRPYAGRRFLSEANTPQ